MIANNATLLFKLTMRGEKFMACVLAERHEIPTYEQLICNLEELLYKLMIVPLVAFLPAFLAYRLACLRGDWRCRHDRFMREQVMYSLNQLLGDQLSTTERVRVTRDFFRRRSCEAIDVMRLGGKGRALARLVEIRGLEHLETALATGKGAIICCAHYGHFSGSFSLLGTHGFPVTAVGNLKPALQETTKLQRWFWRISYEKRVLRHRRRPNIELWKSGSRATFQITHLLRANEIIAIPIDVPVRLEDRGRAVPVEFLGRQILLLPGSVRLAQLTGAQMFVLIARRLPDWRHQVVELVPVPIEDDAIAAFKRCVALVEAPVRQAPAFWDGWGTLKDLIDVGLLSKEV